MTPNDHCKHYHYSWMESYSLQLLQQPPAAAAAVAAVGVAFGADASPAVDVDAAETAVELAAESWEAHLHWPLHLV